MTGAGRATPRSIARGASARHGQRVGNAEPV